MRFKSEKIDGYRIFAVSGINTVSFAIDFDDADTRGMLGFAVERHDKAEDERYFMYGFKVFRSVIPEPDDKTAVSTFDHPIQSFVWDDFTAKPNRDYEYFFYPLKGRPKNLLRPDRPVPIKIRTEPDFSTEPHDVFFNRGVASSQAYTRKFDNVPPDKLEPPAKRLRAEQWLSRQLDEAILEFIGRAKRGDTLLGCFYEFRYEPVARAIKKAIDGGVDVQLIIDAKVNEYTDKQGKFHPSFPRVDNLAMLRKVGIPMTRVRKREARASDIQHNKFMVLLKGASRQPREVWTGSTNISTGAFLGQTNVGHWVRDAKVAASFAAYWDLLKSDPGGRKDDDPVTARRRNAAFRRAVEDLQPVPSRWQDIPQGTSTVFSPRSGDAVLEMYARMIDEAKDLSCITLAFGINNVFKQLLSDNTARDHVTFFLLEKKDKPSKRGTQPFIQIDSRHNVYKAWGSFLKEPLHQWAKETSAGRMGLNQHVSFIHSKFLLMDPLGDDPIVVTGSANFSEPSTNSNDENMLLIRGNRRVADIYFTEFNRLFFHYYFRSVREAMQQRESSKPRNAPPEEDSLFLREDDTWLDKYKPGKLRRKRVQVFTRMTDFET